MMKPAAQRRALILAAVRANGAVRLADLVDQLGVTAVTVRRDVTALADRGLVARVHGGVTMPRRGEPRAAARAGHAPVGLVAPSEDHYWPAVIQGAQAAVGAAGGRLALRTSCYHAAEDRRQVVKLLDRVVQALLVAPVVEVPPFGSADWPAVVSYDDEVAAAADPPPTAVRPRKHRLGAPAAQLAPARVADPLDRPVHRVALWPSLTVRESCRTPQHHPA
ncbi:DeoR family transcriptional regulator [Actinosynnema sp. NPDC059797]